MIPSDSDHKEGKAQLASVQMESSSCIQLVKMSINLALNRGSSKAKYSENKQITIHSFKNLQLGNLGSMMIIIDF